VNGVVVRLVWLDDGTRLIVRPIRPSGKPLLAGALERLSPESAWARFLAVRDHFTSDELVRGIREFTATMHADNIAAHRLFASASQRLQSRIEGGVRHLVVPLAA
jgi:hypothetical protein